MAEEFHLYESLLWEPGAGYYLLERHLERMTRSAAQLGFPVAPEAARQQLDRLAAALPASPRKVRLTLTRDGRFGVSHEEPKPGAPVRAALALEPIDSRDERLHHKTSRRELYEQALLRCPGAQEVILWNQRGELTEACAGNVVLALEGGRFTPPASCGLLPGTFRAELLARGEIAERVLPRESLARASTVWMVNSVRRWCELWLM
jgi:para-aminobenzoate synthetase/4-amino-4-deoxychorismate lyase